MPENRREEGSGGKDERDERERVRERARENERVGETRKIRISCRITYVYTCGSSVS